MRDELLVLGPREVLLPRPASLFAPAPPSDLDGLSAVETRLEDMDERGLKKAPDEPLAQSLWERFKVGWIFLAAIGTIAGNVITALIVAHFTKH